MEQGDDIDKLWQRYLELENRGDRAAVLGALAAFVVQVEAAPAAIRQTWTDACVRATSDPKVRLKVRAPLFQRVLFPELKSRYLDGDAPAARMLAELSQELFRFREGWEALGRPGEIDLWKEAYRRDTSSEVVRSKLVTSTANFIQYTLHELSAGVLYGTDGASVEQCDELVSELALFQGLLTSTESEQFRQLIARASFHYPNYRAYLAQNRSQGYAVYLAQQVNAFDA